MVYLTVLTLAFIQNISFTMVSRARNRDNATYHVVCSIFSNGLWFATMHYLVVGQLTPLMAIPYIAGTVIGSLVGASISMKIETLIGARA